MTERSGRVISGRLRFEERMHLQSWKWFSRWWLRICGGASLAVFVAMHASADDVGSRLAQRVYDRPDGGDVTTSVTMSLAESGHSPRTRSMNVYRRRAASGEVSTLIRFSEPADIEGTGLLTVDSQDGVSNQWIYLPAMQRVRRVDSNRKGGRFVGSDYYFEDLRDRKPALDKHRVIGAESIEGAECDILESLPADPENSVYVRRVSWIERSTLLPLRVEFYESDVARPSKRLVVHKRVRQQGFWTVMDSTMFDLVASHETRLAVSRVVYDRGLPPGLFSTKALSDERQERDYRP